MKFYMQTYPVIMKTASIEDVLVERNIILRYMGYRGTDATDQVNQLIDECLAQLLKIVSYKLCFLRLPIHFLNGNKIDMGFSDVNSADLCKNLKNCDEVVLFAATLGIGVDRLIARYSNASPSSAVIFDAIGTAVIEAWCDKFNEDLRYEEKEKGHSLRPRFSPGYGDLSIEYQKDIIKVLDCNRKIGVMLTDQMLMIPTKSVSAIIGICNE